MLGSNDSSVSWLTHRFTQRHAFKGPWGAAGKLAKHVIMRNEAKFNRRANATYCCLNLLRDLTKTGTKKNPTRWSEWEATGDECVLENRACRTNRALIGLGADDASEFDKLWEEGSNHIVFADRQHLPGCKPVSNAQKTFEVAGHCSKEVDSRCRIDAVKYGCSWSKCREFKGAKNCLFEEDRHVKTYYLKEK